MWSPTPNPEQVRRHSPAMRAAIAEARLAEGTGDVPVGAVIINPDGVIVGRGHNRREIDHDPTAHAEVIALRAAASAAGTWRLDGHTLAVTLEPCAMCAGALVLARMGCVVYAATDPKAGAAGSLWDLLRDQRLNHRPEVVGGVLASEASSLLIDFFAGHRRD